MEVLVLSGLAYIGYELSKDGKTPRRPLKDTSTMKRCNAYPIKDDKMPEVPTPSHNNMVPYFTSAKAQNTNDNYKQRNLETFTGSDNIGFQSKRECEALFQPQANLTNIRGSQLSLSDNNRKDRYANNVTSIMNNVAPIEKQYVGPGLNVGPDVASKGGYHDMYRILPDNVNSYKKHTFAGRVVAGRGVTNQRDSLPTINDNKKPERYYTLCDAPVSANTAPVSGPSVRANVVLHDTTRGTCNPGVGIAGPANMADATMTGVMDATRTADRTECQIIGNPGMPGSGAGAYTKTGTLVNPGQREQCLDTTNVQNQNMGNSVYYNDGAAPTQRGSKSEYSGHIHNAGVVAGQSSTGYNAGPTLREGSSVSYTGNPNQGGVAFGTRSYQANATMRGNNANSYNAPAGSIHKAGVRYSTAQNASVYMQREEMGKEYTPGGGNMNLRGDAQDILPNMIVKDDCNAENYVAPVKGPNAVTFREQLGNVEYVAKLPVHNNRLDLSIAKEQMANNDVAHNINYQRQS